MARVPSEQHFDLHMIVEIDDDADHIVASACPWGAAEKACCQVQFWQAVEINTGALHFPPLFTSGPHRPRAMKVAPGATAREIKTL